MTQILSLEEIDVLMSGLDGVIIDLYEDDDFDNVIPVYLYLQHKITGDFSFFKVDKNFIEQTGVTVSQYRDIHRVISKEYTILCESNKKQIVLDFVKNRYQSYINIMPEYEFMLDFFGKYPEFLI